MPPSLKASATPIVDAYIESWRVSDLATAKPANNWASELRKYMTNPFLQEFTETLHEYATDGTHSVGHVAVTAELKEISGAAATIRGCIDTSHQDLLDKNGHSVAVGDGPGSYWKYVEVAHMTLVGGTWLLARVDSHWDQKCD